MNYYPLLRGKVSAGWRISQGWVAAVLLFFLAWGMAIPTSACPFCNATSQTLSEEIQSADVAVLAEGIDFGDSAGSATNPNPGEPGASETKKASPNIASEIDSGSGMATFRILQALRGKEKLGTTGQLQVVYFGDPQPSKNFLITGISNAGMGAVAGGEEIEPGKPRIDWSTPLPLSKEGVEYIKQLIPLPAKGAERLLFFMAYLEHEDPLLAQDAYDEFARAPYAMILELGDRMDRKQLVDWINDPQVGPTRRRLYLTMLGVCGQAEDVNMLESLLQHDYRQVQPGVAAMVSFAGLAGSAMGLPIVDELVKAESRRKKQCLDALVACYLKLKGPAGMALVDRQFLRNPTAEYTHVYATIMALRFHGEETDVIPRERLLQSLRLVLDNAEIADQVIPDLTRWEDWEIMDKLITMFKTSEVDGWIRQPVISYLVVASEQSGDVGDRAKQALTELEQLDPQTVKRARSLMAFSGFGRAAASPKASTTAPVDEKPEKSNDQDKTVDPRGQAADSRIIEKTVEQKLAEPPSGQAEGVEKLPAAQAVKKPAAIASEQPMTLEPRTDESRPVDNSAADSQSLRTSQTLKTSNTPAKPEPRNLLTKPAAKGALPDPPSRLTMVGVPLIAGLILMGIFAVLLRGSDFREPNS